MAKENNTALSGEIEVAKIRSLQRNIEHNSDLIDGVVTRLVGEYCRSLDEYMEYIAEVVGDSKNPPVDTELDAITLRLPVLLYFTGEAQESLGIKEDVAKAVRQELYNEFYEQTSGTIGDKTAAAEAATQNEYLTLTAYQRAYKKVKLRMEAASEMLQSTKKVMSRRMAEYEMSRVDPQRVGGN